MTHLGYSVDTQVGCAGFFIDLGVEDPDAPGRYILGIECDGASYHSAKTARDRDRLRQSVLENLGWRIHRIWSADWFRDPRRELKRTVEAIEQAMTYRQTADICKVSIQSDARHEIQRTDVEYEEQELAGEKYEVANLRIGYDSQEFRKLPNEKVAGYIYEIVNKEGPIHKEVAMRRLRAEAGIGGGTLINAKIEDAINLAIRNSSIEQRGEFLWPKGLKKVQPRDRSVLDIYIRKAEAVAPEEIDAAIIMAVEASFGLDKSRLRSVIAKILGIPSNQQLQNIVDQRTTFLVHCAILAKDGNELKKS